MKKGNPDVVHDANKSLAPQQPTDRIHLTAESLFAHTDEIIIDHAGQAYRLRITRNGKLILTK